MTISSPQCFEKTQWKLRLYTCFICRIWICIQVFDWETSSFGLWILIFESVIYIYQNKNSKPYRLWCGVYNIICDIYIIHTLKGMALGTYLNIYISYIYITNKIIKPYPSGYGARIKIYIFCIMYSVPFRVWLCV